jgi:hypothetical protein
MLKAFSKERTKVFLEKTKSCGVMSRANDWTLTTEEGHLWATPLPLSCFWHEKRETG